MQINLLRLLPIMLIIFLTDVVFVNVNAQNDTSYYVYVSLKGDNGIAVYQMNYQTGDLEKIYTEPVSGGPASLAIDPLEQHLYVAQRSSNSISGYNINKSTGRLSLINSIAAVDNPVYISTDRSGRFLLSAYYNASKAADYSIKSGGVIEGTPVKSISTGINPHAILTDPSNRFLYISNMTGNKIQQFSFDSASGTFAALEPPEILPSEDIGPRHFVFHGTKKIVYFVNETGNSVTAYHINDTTGCLTEIQTISTLPADFTSTNKSADIHLTQDNRFLYASNRGHESIAGFRVDSISGLLTIVDQYPTVTSPREFDIDPSGTFLYAAGETSNDLACYRINKTTGELDSLYTIYVGKTPSWVLVLQFIDSELSGMEERNNLQEMNESAGVHPNPFSSACTIQYFLEYPSAVSVEIYDATSRLVKIFKSFSYESGLHQIEWDGKDNDGNLMDNGVYFCAINIGEKNNILKILLIR